MLDLTTCQDCLFSAKDGEYYQCLENSPDNENFGKNMSPNDFCKYCRRKERKMKEDNFIVTNGPTYLGSFERLEYALIFIQEYLEKYYNECEVTIHRNLHICEKNEKLNRGS